MEKEKSKYLLIERGLDGEWQYKDRSKLKVFLNVAIFLNSEETPAEWEELYGLPEGSLKEAIQLVGSESKAYESWLEDFERDE
jgi:hypothetical protein